MLLHSHSLHVAMAPAPSKIFFKTCTNNRIGVVPPPDKRSQFLPTEFGTPAIRNPFNDLYLVEQRGRFCDQGVVKGD